jgi:hypothetical protein
LKKGIFLQIIIITIILLIWNALHLGYQYQKDFLEKQLSKIPMILISQDVASLDSLHFDIADKIIIRRIIVEPDSVVALNLMENYQLEEAENLLENFHLPSIMKIFFTGREFSSTAKLNLEDFIMTNYPQIAINYDNHSWVKIDRKISFLTKSYYYGNGFLALFILISIIFLRLYQEAKYHEYWRIYRNSGGKRKKRRQQFFKNSLLLCLLPIFLNLAAYFLLQYLNYLFLEIDLRFFAAEFGFVVFSVLLSRTFLGSNI